MRELKDEGKRIQRKAREFYDMIESKTDDCDVSWLAFQILTPRSFFVEKKNSEDEEDVKQIVMNYMFIIFSTG